MVNKADASCARDLHGNGDDDNNGNRDDHCGGYRGNDGQYPYIMVGGVDSGRMSVFGQRTFPVVRATFS